MAMRVPTLRFPPPRRAPGSHVIAIAWTGPVKAALVLFCGAVLGLSLTAWTVYRKIDPAALAIGPWVTWPKAGTTEIDPYAQAIGAQAGTINLAAAEGVSFTASTDDAGYPLSARCAYRVAGATLAARQWTVAATTPAGVVMENAAGRHGFTSSEILRRQDGSFDIVVAPSAYPGNWLPVSGEARFVLTLRLYDTPLTSVAADLRKAVLPSLTALGCPS